MQLIVESTRDGWSVVRTERRTKIIGCWGVKCRKKVNAQQISLHLGRSISVERVNVVNVERIFAWYRKLEIKRLQAGWESFVCSLFSCIKESESHYSITIVSVYLDLSVHVSSFPNFEPNENCALLGYYVTSNGNYLPTFRENLSVPSSGFKTIKPWGWER
jgi:hypothetical protein